MSKIFGLVAFSVFCGILFSCSHGDIQIENNYKNATIVNVEWGGYPITDFLQPGQLSSKRKIDNSDYYNIKLPESYALSYLLITENDTTYCETKEFYTIEHDKFTLISLNDDTEVLKFPKDYNTNQ